MHQTLMILSMLLFCCSAVAFAQLTFSDSSRIKDPTWLERRVKYLTDDELFSSMNLDAAELAELREIIKEKKEYWKAYEAWGRYWDAKPQPRFLTMDFVEPYDSVLAYYENHPAEKESILVSAEKILNHDIRGWGESSFQFGPIVDFNADYGKSGKYGFHYWSFGQPLNTAYLLTKDTKYLQAFDELFNQWYGQRYRVVGGWMQEAGLDVIFYELGLLRNRIFLEHYFFAYPERSWQTHERMLKTMLGSARWLYELERWEGYRSGNWQAVGSYALVLIGLAFSEFKESESWIDMGLQRLGEHLEKDFFADGGHFERSPYMYTMLTYSQFRNMYDLLRLYNVYPDVREQYLQSLGKTIDWWITMLTPQGEISAINDAHRGRIPAKVLLDGAELFGLKEVYGVLRNLYGMSFKDAPLPSYTSRNLSASGFAVMRSDWTPNALYMNINYGGWGGGHTHNDLLDFEICAYGKPLAIDAGIGLTYDDPIHESWYRTSKAHNMVVVNAANIDRQGISAENVVWSSQPSADYFAGEHRGYARFGVHHRRHIAFIKPFYWVVLDDLKSAREGETLSWYFHSPTRLQKTPNGFQSQEPVGILIMPAEEGLATRVGKGFASYSPEFQFGKNKEIDWIAFDQKSQLGEQEFAVLLYPFVVSSVEPYQNQAPTVKTQEISVKFRTVAANHYVVETKTFADHLYFLNQPYDDGEVATDALFLLVRYREGKPECYSLTQGSYLRLKGEMIFSAGSRTDSEGRVD